MKTSSSIISASISTLVMTGPNVSTMLSLAMSESSRQQELVELGNLHESIADPIATQGNIVLQHGNSLANVRCMSIWRKAEAQSALPKHRHVYVEGLVFDLILVCDRIER